MVEIDVTSAPTYALDRGLFPPDADLQAEWLSGGVSNVVLRLTDRDSGLSLILKQAREKLRVQADWRSRLDRIWREVLVLQTLAPAFAPITVPVVLFEDRDNYLFAMTAVPRGHTVWKSDLLEGRMHEELIPQLGEFLADVHSRPVDSLPRELASQDVFDELRLDPYYRWTAARVPEAAAALNALVDAATSRRSALVLADFSPKNILLWNDAFTVIDFETAHLGDPAFDLGFFLTHLVLKSLHAPGFRETLPRAIGEFWNAYHDARTLSDSGLKPLAMRHLAGCLLARVDGKSPVDYLSASEQQQVRDFAVSMLRNPAADWPDFEHHLRQTLLAHS